MTIAAALFFDNAVFPQITNSNGSPLSVQPKWVGLGILNPDGHAYFVMAMVVLVVCIIGVLLLRRGTDGRFLTAMRGSETAAAGLGINLTWQRVMIFGISGVVAGIGGTLLAIQQQSVNTAEFNYQISLAFVVIVVTTGVSTIEGALQAGFGFVVIQQLLTYLPARFGGNSLIFVLFAFGATDLRRPPRRESSSSRSGAGPCGSSASSSDARTRAPRSTPGHSGPMTTQPESRRSSRSRW